jgi:tetratricopeptide (TPR) repeat protein
LIGFNYYFRGDFELSQSHFEAWFNLCKVHSPKTTSFDSAIYRIYLGLVELKEGQIESVKNRLDEVKSLLPELDSDDKEKVTSLYDFLIGEMLIVENSADKAISVLKKITPLKKARYMYFSYYYSMAWSSIFDFEDTLARAYRQKGEIDKAVVVYEKRIRFDPNSDDRRLIYPLSYYKLAKLYEQKRNEKKAIENYERFLALWKNADPGIADVEDAKKRLAGLQE